MKGVGMLLISLRGVNFGFWSHFGCSGENSTMCTSICSSEGLVSCITRRTIKTYI